MTKIEKYLIKFDATSGTRGETYPVDCTVNEDRINEMVAEGYTLVDDADYQYYIGNHGMGDNGTGYVCGNEGKPVSAPAYVPSKEEQANTLAATYAAAVKTANNGIILASAEGDTDAIDEYKADKAAAMAEYKAKLEALNNG